MSERTDTPAVELKQLSKAFRGHLGIGRTVAVDGLDLTVHRGEIYGLLGPNGAGKTTTLKMMLGLVRPDRGSVQLLGRPPGDPAARSRVGFLPENPYFYTYLTAQEFLDFYARLQGMKGARRRELTLAMLARVGLAGRERTPLGKFSKGMIQRLGLAQALQHDPDLVILDEPMSGLDPIGRREVRDLILSLGREGKTVFFSSHILQDAELICDRIAILENGRLRSAGRLDELLSNKLRGFEIAVRGPLPDVPGAVRITRDGDRALLRVGDVDALTRVLGAVKQSGAEVLSLTPLRDTLEELFLREIRGSGPGARA